MASSAWRCQGLHGELQSDTSQRGCKQVDDRHHRTLAWRSASRSLCIQNAHRSRVVRAELTVGQIFALVVHRKLSQQRSVQLLHSAVYSFSRISSWASERHSEYAQSAVCLWSVHCKGMCTLHSYEAVHVMLLVCCKQANVKHSAVERKTLRAGETTWTCS